MCTLSLIHPAYLIYECLVYVYIHVCQEEVHSCTHTYKHTYYMHVI